MTFDAMWMPVIKGTKFLVTSDVRNCGLISFNPGLMYSHFHLRFLTSRTSLSQRTRSGLVLFLRLGDHVISSIQEVTLKIDLKTFNDLPGTWVL